MLRLGLAAILAGAGVVGLAGDEPGKAEPTLPRTERIPDPRWEPAVGERVEVPGDTAWGATTFRAFDRHFAAGVAGDQAGMNEGFRSGEVVKLPGGSKVLILKDHKPAPGPSRTLSSGGLTDALNHARPADREDAQPVEVRVLDGPEADRLLYVSRREIARMVEARVVPVLRPGEKPVVAKPGTVIAKDADELYAYKFAGFDGDRSRIVAAIREGRLARLEAGAKVLVIAQDGERCRVRVFLGSKLVGITGYVPSGDLIPPATATPPATRPRPATK